jgi:hypothetical protein
MNICKSKEMGCLKREEQEDKREERDGKGGSEVEEKQSLTGNNFVNFVEPRKAEKNE